MGKKFQKKQTIQNSSNAAAVGGQRKKLSPQKRNELNELIDNLLKVTLRESNNVTELWNIHTEIMEILDRCQKIEATVKVKGPPKNQRSSNIESFISWCKKNGAQFDGLKISEFPGYDLGLEAGKTLTKNDIFIAIPKKMIMSEETLSSSKALSIFISEIPLLETMPHVKLAFALLLEKLNPESFWKSYIDLLPDKYTTVMYYSLNEMQELKGSNCLSATLSQCKNIARQYAFIYKCIHKIKNDENSTEILKEKFTYELYRWAVSTVMTRQNSIPSGMAKTNDNNTEKSSKINDSVSALIPLWDLVNHKDGQFSTSYNIELDRLESFAFTDFTKGDQIFMYYGHRSNAEFLIHNGFIYPNNLKDSVSIRLGLGNHDVLYSEKSKLLDQLHIAHNCELKILQPPEFISPHLLAFARIFNMNKDQLNHWLNSDRSQDLLHIDCALETSLETKTWTFLQTRLHLLLRVFPTTLEEDTITLNNHLKGQAKLGHIKAMLLHYRILEKRILLNALDYAKQRIKP